MEIYLLISSVVTLIGVICIIVFLEKHSRTCLARFNKEREDTQQLLQTLAAIYASIEQTNVLLNKLDVSQKEGSNEILARLDALNENAKSGVEKICRTQYEQVQNLQKTIQETTKQIEAKLQENTKQVQTLKTSLEESVKF